MENLARPQPLNLAILSLDVKLAVPIAQDLRAGAHLYDALCGMQRHSMEPKASRGLLGTTQIFGDAPYQPRHRRDDGRADSRHRRAGRPAIAASEQPLKTG